jgi:hypothetical protein
MLAKINDLTTKGDINLDDSHIEFIAHPSSKINLFHFFSLSSSVPLPSINLKRVAYTFATNELVIATRGYGSQVIIPEVLNLQNIILSLTVHLQNVNTLVVTFTGDFIIGSKTIPVKAVYSRASKDIKITATVSQTSINFQTIAKQLVGLKLPSALHKSVTVPKFTMTGIVTSSGKSELIVSSTGGKIQVYIIYKKTTTSSKAIAVDIPNTKLASILKDIVRRHISKIPYFGTVVLPRIALTYASHNTSLPRNIFAKSHLLNSIGSSLEKGLTALIKFSFSDKPIKVHYGGGSLLTFSPILGSLNVKTLTSAIPRFDLSKIPLPPGINQILNLDIETFSLNIKTKTMKLVVGYPRSLKFFNGLLRLQNLKFTITKGRNGRVKVDIHGDLSISGQKFHVSITQSKQSGKYVLRARAKRLPITSLISQLRSKILPSELNSLLSKLPFFGFSLNDPVITFPFSTPHQIQLQGTPIISGYKTVRMSSMVIRQGAKNLLVQGFKIGSLNLATLLKSITGFNFKKIALLNMNVKASILISPASLPNVHLAGSKAKGVSIKRGMSVQATMTFPPKCSTDALCAVAQFLLGADAVLSVRGTIASMASFTLFAGVANINLGSGIVMSQAGVEIQGGTTNSIGIVGAVDLSNPDITLAARIFLSTSGVVLEMTMSGCWKNAFGAKWLDICSLHASVAMVPGVTLTGLALGGEVHIGYRRCGKPLVATGFVGFDVVTPTNNYYYVNIKGSTTVRTILKAFCLKIRVPAPLAKSGFPHGFISSFSLAGVELPHVPLSIPQGYRLNGTINILGLEASADVVIGLPNGIDFTVALPPIHVGGLLQMSRSSSDKSHGPIMHATISLLPIPKVDILAKGYLSVLGISVETSLKVTNTQYIFKIKGKMLNLFEASLRIAASYGNIQRAKFTVWGSFTNELSSTLENQVKNSLDKAGKSASSKLDAAKKKLTQFRNSFNSANSAFQAGKRKVDDAKRSFDAANAKVANLNNKVNSICHISNCGNGKDRNYHITTHNIAGYFRPIQFLWIGDHCLLSQQGFIHGVGGGSF